MGRHIIAHSLVLIISHKMDFNLLTMSCQLSANMPKACKQVAT